MKPEISIIVPVYKVEKYLQRCINSILHQSFINFELILVDDGSPDNSGKICDEYMMMDNRVKVIHKENGGLSSARNAGLDISRGKYISFIDSDDWISEDMIETLYKLCTTSCADISEGQFRKVFNDEILKEEYVEENTIELNNIDAMEALYKNTFYGTTISCNKLYRKELFKDIRFPQGKLNEDQFTTYKILYKCNKMISTSKVIYYYYQSNNSITRSSFSIKKLDAIEALEETRRFYIDNNLNNLVLWHDTLYSAVLIKYYKLLKLEGKKYKYLYSDILRKYKLIYIDFIKNPHINKKIKILLTLFYISPRCYISFLNNIILDLLRS